MRWYHERVNIYQYQFVRPVTGCSFVSSHRRWVTKNILSYVETAASIASRLPSLVQQKEPCLDGVIGARRGVRWIYFCAAPLQSTNKMRQQKYVGRRSLGGSVNATNAAASRSQLAIAFRPHTPARFDRVFVVRLCNRRLIVFGPSPLVASVERGGDRKSLLLTTVLPMPWPWPLPTWMEGINVGPLAHRKLFSRSSWRSQCLPAAPDTRMLARSDTLMLVWSDTRMFGPHKPNGRRHYTNSTNNDSS